MARTHRDKNHTAAARASREALWDSLPIGAYADQFEPHRPARLRGGNMLMAPSVSGIWADERAQNGSDRRRERRAQKRSERHGWKKAALDAVD